VPEGIKCIGIVGCGQMGTGIAEVCARAGYTVMISDLNSDLVERGLHRIENSLGKAVARGKLTEEERAAVRPRIIGATDASAFGNCDLVIEAVAENLDLKRQVFAELDAHAPAHAILASNTSSLPVIEMASATNRPSQVLGLHFMQPAPVMPLVEVVRTFLTSDECFVAARQVIESLGKTVVVSQDTPGFIVNLLLIPSLLHAIEASERGVATHEDMDTAVKLGLGHPMGPFALLDFIGLDTVLAIADAVYGETRDARFIAPPLLRRMVSAGHLGRKSGAGFYSYTDQS
jgi:3-hydroxybutyryl-CoA dehydrogenase